MKSSRRKFLKQSAALASGTNFVFPASFAAVQENSVSKGTIIGPGAVDNENTGQREFFLGIIDLDKPEPYPVSTIELDFFAHGVSPNTKHPARAALFQKQGSGACEVDLIEKSVLRPITTAADRRFYGHGAYSPDGSILYATETIMSSPELKGIVAVRDADSHEYLGEFPSYGAQPHDCQLIDGGKIMAVTNGGLHFGHKSTGRVSFVEIATQKLVDQVVIDSEEKNAGHLFISPKGHLAIVSAERDGLDEKQFTGGITLRPAGGEAILLWEPVELLARMIGETLSVYIDDATGIVAATTPAANLVTFWNIRTGELVKSMNVPDPRGIALTLDGKFWALSCSNAVLTFLHADTLEAANIKPVFPSYTTGSHVIPYALNG